jgi:enterochelin esterase-like enzyme
MKTLPFLFMMLSCMGILAQVPSPSAGSIKQHPNFESKIVKPRNIDVWLPNGYSTKQKYAVLYMHDGQMLFDGTHTWNKQEWQADEVAGALMDQEATKPFIIVGISNISEDRHCEYFPQKPFETLSVKQQDSLYSLNRQDGSKIFQGKISSDNYLKFIVTELKPFIDKNYATLTDAANTFMGGSSMGGLISLYAICEYPNIFGGAACLSTHWIGIYEAANNPIPEAFFKYLATKLPDPKNHKLYFDRGTETLDASYKPFQDKADDIVKKKGFTSAQMQSKVWDGAAHSEEDWASRIDQPMIFLLGR